MNFKFRLRENATRTLLLNLGIEFSCMRTMNLSQLVQFVINSAVLHHRPTTVHAQGTGVTPPAHAASERSACMISVGLYPGSTPQHRVGRRVKTYSGTP